MAKRRMGELSLEELRTAFRVLQHLSESEDTTMGDLHGIYAATRTLALLVMVREDAYERLDASVARLEGKD